MVAKGYNGRSRREGDAAASVSGGDEPGCSLATNPEGRALSSAEGIEKLARSPRYGLRFFSCSDKRNRSGATGGIYEFTS
ncbi:MAG: hypothetical protein JXQ84_03485 [Rhodospirillaceae bacterium]|nr:hypothetical protein [Rhodospirillaceae bacterium]